MNDSTRTTPAWALWMPAVAWAAVIFVGSSIPGSAIPGGYSVWGHLTEYAVLAALVMLAERRRGNRAAIAIALGFVALYGASDEIHQIFVPLRTPDPIDWLTDIAGACVGIALWLAAAGIVARLRHRPRAGRSERRSR